ncbi:UNVERIFIED_CONTAM: hypothetical protein HDU68_001410 [Siphonaria sp. JEL0065]|nr:hypothetical protein HDU68_001410 [Siphonaria sp. JEL0065]
MDVPKKVQKLLHGIAVKERQPFDSILHVSRDQVPADSDCRVLCLLNVGNDSGVGDVAAIEMVLATLPGFESLKVSKGRSFSFAAFTSATYAQSAFLHLDNALFTSSAKDPSEIILPASQITVATNKENGRSIHLLFAKQVPFPPIDTLTNPADILHEIPGLHIIPDFISPEEACQLVQGMDVHPWINLSERQVQHHGFTFDYNNNHIDFSKDPGPLPTWCHFLISRMDETIKKLASEYPNEFSYRGFNQLTINKYPAGSGISPHVDTHTRFDSPITSVSLLTPVQMEWRTLYHTSDCREVSKTLKTVQVLLPPLSVCFMAGESRFAWEHAIRQRRADVVNCKRVDRELRISLTFRGVRLCQEECVCDCGWDAVCDAKIVGGAVPDRLKEEALLKTGVNRHGVSLK